MLTVTDCACGSLWSLVAKVLHREPHAQSVAFGVFCSVVVFRSLLTPLHRSGLFIVAARWGIVPAICWSTSIPHILSLCFLGFVATTPVTTVFEGMIKHSHQT